MRSDLQFFVSHVVFWVFFVSVFFFFVWIVFFFFFFFKYWFYFIVFIIWVCFFWFVIVFIIFILVFLFFIWVFFIVFFFIVWIFFLRELCHSEFFFRIYYFPVNCSNWMYLKMFFFACHLTSKSSHNKIFTFHRKFKFFNSDHLLKSIHWFNFSFQMFKAQKLSM